HHEAFAGVLVAGAERRLLPRAHARDRICGGDRVLHAPGDTGNASDGVRMPLAESAAPERVRLALRQYRLAVEALQGEQARIPAGGDDGGRSARARRGVDGGEVLRNAGVRVEAVDDGE